MGTRVRVVVIAGTHSGCGKTTMTLGLMAALRRRGLCVQGFKVGPDYIDPMFHQAATGRPSRNLDLFMMPRSAALEVFARGAHEADIAIVEGVMGLFDGASFTRNSASTAAVANLLGAPVVLVVDAQSMARSVAAVVKGFAEFDPKLRVAGVVLNRVGSDGHAAALKKSLRTIPVMGYLERNHEFVLPERHLGLVPVGEAGMARDWTDRLAEAVERTFDLDALLKCAAQHEVRWSRRRCRPAVRVGVARDRAFNFYYPENLELLEEAGAELVPFSPLADPKLPKVDALFFGGGFPELFAERLEANRAMRTAVRDAVLSLPVYAECGGLMYLAEALVNREGRAHEMVGAIPGRVCMTDRLQNFGYSMLRTRVDTLLAETGTSMRGHEFHYSTWTGEPNAYEVRKRSRAPARVEGYARGNLLASYVHLHFMSRPSLARAFVRQKVVR